MKNVYETLKFIDPYQHNWIRRPYIQRNIHIWNFPARSYMLHVRCN